MRIGSRSLMRGPLQPSALVLANSNILHVGACFGAIPPPTGKADGFLTKTAPCALLGRGPAAAADPPASVPAPAAAVLLRAWPP